MTGARRLVIPVAFQAITRQVLEVALRCFGMICTIEDSDRISTTRERHKIPDAEIKLSKTFYPEDE